MKKVILLFRYSVLAIITIPAIALLLKSVHWWWLCCNSELDPIFLVATDDIRVMAGDSTVILPKGLVLYPVNEREEKESFYPGGQYKIYVTLDEDASNLSSIGWPNGNTNLILKLKR